jgi:hypothetical protein
MTFDEILKDADKRLFKIPLEDLDLSARNAHAAQKANLRTIDELLCFGLDNFVKLQNVGKKSILEIQKAIIAAHRKLQFGDEDLLYSPQRGRNCEELIEEMVELLPEKDLDIFIERFGYNTGEMETLQEIGQLHKMTRERVRQITSKQLLILKKSKKGYLREIIEHIERILEQYNGILSIKEVCADIFFSYAEEIKVRFLLNVVTAIYKDRYSFLDKDFLTSLDDEQLKALNSFIQETILKCTFPVAENVFWKTVLSELSSLSKDYLSHYLKKEHITILKGEVLAPGRLTIPKQVRIIMKKEGRPLHYSEITKLYKKQFGDRRNHANIEHLIHTRIGDSSDFLLVERGTFILREDFKVPSNINEIVNTSRDILRDVGQASDTIFIINQLKKQSIDIGELNAYSLKGILLEYPGFRKYRKFDIGLEDFGEKRSLTELIHEILVSVKNPLHSRDIYREVRKKRGLPRYSVEQKLYKEPIFIKTAAATYTVKENIDSYRLKCLNIIDLANQWIRVKKSAVSPFLLNEVLKELGHKGIFPGLVEHALATNPKFIKLSNGFYYTAPGQNATG